VTVLRGDLLHGRAVALAGGVTSAVSRALSALGASVHELDPALDEDGARDWAGGVAPLHALVFDAAPMFGDGGQAHLGAALEAAWVATRGVATGALIPAGAGKVLLLAPRPASASFAGAARAALENVARTLSVEWARYGVTAVAIAPGARATDDDLAELVCFLVSVAGDYFSGCAFELGSGGAATSSYAPLSPHLRR
jgi:NAD(P)-dependent dehydrogenase (short-subunit alcohol dehydrogenase family)